MAAHLRVSATRLARLLRRQGDTGLSPSQLSALTSIERHGPMTLGALADHERVAPPSITKVVDKLEERGLVAARARRRSTGGSRGCRPRRPARRCSADVRAAQGPVAGGAARRARRRPARPPRRRPRRARRPHRRGSACDAGGTRQGRGRETFRSLQHRNFRLFFTGQLISQVGNWLTLVAQTLLVLKLTDSGVALGVLAAAQFGPILVLGPWAGLIADRSDKRAPAAGRADGGHGPVVRCWPPWPSAATRRSVAIYAVAVLGGVSMAFDNPARRSFVVEMVARAASTTRSA